MSLMVLITRVMALQGRKRYGLCALLGILVTLALPPVHWIVLLPIVFPLFFWLILGSQTRRQAFYSGWWFGLGHFVVGIYWISFSLLTDFDKFFWLMPLAIFGLPLLLAFYTAVTAWLTYSFPTNRLGKLLVFAMIWTLGELFRGTSVNFFSLYGFPWNLLGYVWSFSDVMVQPVALMGVYGLSLLTIITMTLPALAVDPSSGKRVNFVPVMVALVILAVWGGVSYQRLIGGELTYVDDVMVRVVQPNVTKHHRWQPALRLEKMLRHVQASRLPSDQPITHLIWPESAIPFFMDNRSFWYRFIHELIPENGALIGGTFRQEGAGETRKIWTSLHVLGKDRDVSRYYDKYRLVPFGEYVPHRQWIPLKNIYGSIDFTQGDGPKTLAVPGAPPMGPLICYDAIFPQSVVDPNNRPAWLVNITNDAWFELRSREQAPFWQFSSGPYQHFSMIRLRAVEQGLPLFRAANTGVSAVIGPYGRVLHSLPLGSEGVIDSRLPHPSSKRTLYSQYGDRLLWGMLLCMAVILLCLRYVNKIYSPKG